MNNLVCRFCFEEFEFHEAEIDRYGRGFWCQCDGFTYIDEGEGIHRFTLLLEDKQRTSTPAPRVNLKFQKQLSLLRYPGGKSKFIPHLYLKLQSNKTETMSSSYCGGASAEFAFLQAGVIKHLRLNDLDFGIYALWWVVQHMPDELVYRIRHYQPTHKSFFQAQSIVKSDYNGCTIMDAAWNTLIVNRLAFSGIYKANPLGGRQGTVQDLTSRWNPKALIKRIYTIHALGDRYTVSNLDACEFIEEEYWRDNCTLFIDPPFYEQGKNLYRCYYDEEQHFELKELLESLYHGMPGADIILCCDNAPFIEQLYFYPEIEKVGRVYSC